MKNNNEFEAGSKVTYKNGEIGMIKSLKDNSRAYVCYHCKGQWDRIEMYTGQLTALKDLTLGWPKEQDSESDKD